MNQLSLLSGMPTAAKSSENERQTDGSQACQCGKGMSDCLIHPNTPEEWIASMRDSLAKTLALLESRQAYLREPDQVFTDKSCVLLASLSPDSSFWKTCQQSFLTDSEPYSQTWPRWGMTQGGYAYAHPMSERRITETGGGCLPTPTATDNKSETMSFNLVQKRKDTSTRGVRLSEFLLRRMLPTPNAWSSHWGGRLDELGGSNNIFRGTYIGKLMLNPVWMEHIMGFPTDFTASKHSETPKSRSKPQQPGDYSEASK